MTSGKCRSSVVPKVIIVGSLVGYGGSVWALAHAATGGSTPAGVPSSAQAPGSSMGTAPQPADAPFPPSDAPSAVPALRPSEAPPAEAYRFSVDPKLNDEVVGEVQITRTTPQDSLPDIARRFSVGYNEIQRANPGVDMWVPGAGSRVVVPTQFVLPDALHVGIVVNIAEMRLYYFPP